MRYFINKIILFQRVELNKMSMVKANDQWHRAVVIDAIGDGKPECAFVDLKLFRKVQAKNIFAIPAVLDCVPVLVNEYKIQEYDSLNVTMKSCLKNIIAENEILKVDEIKKVGDDLILKFNNLLNQD
jgi:Tudor domain